jgi:PhzF family phenazine biosynthesis protein
MRAFVVDAFTGSAFTGNPAGVVLLDEPADAEWMQAVAAEFRHAETAFLLPHVDGGYDLRWFTPALEVDLCGHATLATAHVLAADGISGPIAFDTRSGRLTAHLQDDGSIELDFPARPVQAIAAPDGLAAALGVEPLGSYANSGGPFVRDILVEVASAREVDAVSPDLSGLREIESRGVIVTALAAPDSDHDFVSRFFAPRAGVDEDPVTGSAHCALAPFWSQRLGRDRLIGVQRSARGGRVHVQVVGDRVRLGGRAVTVLAGELSA